MKPPSSTSSSRTLAGFPRVTRAAALAIAILATLEVAVRLLMGSGALAPDPTLDTLVEGNLADLVVRKPRIWLLGNSTLAWGVHREDLEARTGRGVAKLVHGSATARASAAMLDYYLLKGAAPPDRVLLLVSWDDLNPNGGRARASEQYLDYATGFHVSPLRSSALFQTRGGIRGDLLRRLLGMAQGLRAEAPATAGRETSSLEEGGGDSHDLNLPWLRSLAAGFEVDRGAFEALRGASRRGPVRETRVVLLPSTAEYFRLHESMLPEWPLDRVKREVAAACAANGLAYSDLTGTFQDRASYRDAYHLNEAGAARMTVLLARLLDQGPR